MRAATLAKTTTQEETSTFTSTTKNIEFTAIFPPARIYSIDLKICRLSDIVFVLDSTKSSNYGQLYRTLITLVRPLDLTNGENRVGLVTFGKEATIDITLDDFSSSTSLTKSLRYKYRPKKSLQCNIADGLRKTKQLFFSQSSHSNRYKVAIVVVDGQSNIEKDKNLIEADQLKNIGVKVIIVSISRFVSLKELGPLISVPYQENTIWINGFKDLNAMPVLNWIKRKMCPLHLCR